MIICQCAAISDRDIVHAVRHGADTLPEVCHRTGAGLCCGACRRDVLAILRAEQSADEPSLPHQFHGVSASV